MAVIIVIGSGAAYFVSGDENMNIYIGENIKRLRREKDITQEKLAEFLNISCQAISKWERNESYPDITMVIPIASFFGVSTDELLGLDSVKNEQKIKEYLDEAHRLGALGKTHEKFDLVCKAYKEFPNDFRIVEEYAWQLNYDPNCSEPHGDAVHKDELYRLCNRMLEDCTLDQPRYSALSILGGLYLLDGNTEMAIKIANRFPSHYLTADEECENIYRRNGIITDEWWPWVRKNIRTLTEMLTVKIRNCALYSKLPPEEKIRIFKKAITVFEIVYDQGDYNFYNYDLAELHIWIANRYIEMKEYGSAFEYLSKGLGYAKTYDELPQLSKHTSFLVNTLTLDMMEISSGSECNDVSRELGYLSRPFMTLSVIWKASKRSSPNILHLHRKRRNMIRQLNRLFFIYSNFSCLLKSLIIGIIKLKATVSLKMR